MAGGWKNSRKAERRVRRGAWQPQARVRGKVSSVPVEQTDPGGLSPDAFERVVAVDLFCGAGGLTHGLERVGIDVTLGVDLDPRCAFPYTENNSATFLPASVSALTGAEIKEAFGDAPYRLLAGCAPCQPFSSYSQGRKPSEDERWNLLAEFGRLVVQSGANVVTMENVPKLVKEKVFDDFVALLVANGFRVKHQIVDCVRYGVPQTRRRLVLLASKLGEIDLVPPDDVSGMSVLEAIGHMPRLDAGGRDGVDRLHASALLSPINLARIRASVPGGTWRDWPSGSSPIATRGRPVRPIPGSTAV
ncbi:DNA cytosine methyltransferase [Methylobacterium komagatae]|uniref:DNA (cytosine-5-)-methyltransferase n=1 Tax=Methylobacterium komagatae TaxID=374425 RepID=A0ABW2BKM2_9HYPH